MSASKTDTQRTTTMLLEAFNWDLKHSADNDYKENIVACIKDVNNIAPKVPHGKEFYILAYKKRVHCGSWDELTKPFLDPKTQAEYFKNKDKIYMTVSFYL